MSKWKLAIRPLVTIAAVPMVLSAGCSGKRSLLTNASAPQPNQTPQLQVERLDLAQQPAIQVQAVSSPTTKATGRVYLAGGKVSFLPPAGFTAMRPDEIAFKFPNRGGNPPQHVYANERRSVAVAITFSPAQISPEQLPELKSFMPKFMEQAMPNIKWVTQGFAAINNVRWVQLEFVSRAVDTEVHNDTYLTSFQGKMLGFNFNSTVQQYAAMKTQLRQSRDSITISQ